MSLGKLRSLRSKAICDLLPRVKKIIRRYDPLICQRCYEKERRKSHIWCSDCHSSYNKTRLHLPDRNCSHCGLPNRSPHSWCKPCRRIRDKKWRKKQAEKEGRTFRSRSPASKICLICNKNPKHSNQSYCAKCLGFIGRRYNQLKNGIENPPSVSQYQKMLAALTLTGKCPCCKRINKGRWHLHHNHDTGQWLTLICSKCNVGFGMYSDDIRIMRRALKWFTRNH